MCSCVVESLQLLAFKDEVNLLTFVYSALIADVFVQENDCWTFDVSETACSACFSC